MGGRRGWTRWWEIEEKYALIRVSAGNLWICGEPDAHHRWLPSRDSCSAARTPCYSSTVNPVHLPVLFSILGVGLCFSAINGSKAAHSRWPC